MLGETMRTIPVLIATMALVFLSVIGYSATATATASVANVSAAAFHTVVLTDDGAVWTWGWANTPWGILGTGSDQSDGSLHRLDALPAIVAVDAKFKTSLAIDKDGRVWAWGDNEFGQCGINGNKAVPSPVLVPNLAHIVQVSNGGLHCAAVDESGHVWTWGDNEYGQLGTGRTGSVQYTPVQVPIDNVKMVSAGSGYTVALKKDGTVWAWGENDLGMSGGSGKGNVLSPRKVEGLWNIVKISAGYDHTLALRDDGTVWAWGDGEENKICNGDGYLGTSEVRVPVQVNGLPSVRDIAAGDHSSMVLGRDGSVYSWGSNGDGQYGNGIDLWMPAQSPVKLPGMDNVVSISTGYGHSLAVKNDGSLWVWGRNLEDQVQPGKGKKVMTPLKKLEGGTAITEQHSTPTTAASSAAAASAGADMVVYITVGGVVLLAIAVIGFILLLRMRK
jgi:alpha-tubulin suppressor-like RCC1 family protein